MEKVYEVHFPIFRLWSINAQYVRDIPLMINSKWVAE